MRLPPAAVVRLSALRTNRKPVIAEKGKLPRLIKAIEVILFLLSNNVVLCTVSAWDQYTLAL